MSDCLATDASGVRSLSFTVLKCLVHPWDLIDGCAGCHHTYAQACEPPAGKEGATTWHILSPFASVSADAGKGGQGAGA